MVAIVIGGFAVSAAHGPRPSFGPPVDDEVQVSNNDPRLARAQNSPVLAADPRDSDLVVLASRLDAPRLNCALHRSRNGGRRWEGVNPVPRLPPGADTCYAPEVAFGPSGQLYYLFIGLHGRGNEPMGVFLTVSEDGGEHFGPPRQILGANRFAVRMAIDNAMGRHGRIHLVWIEAGADPVLGGFQPVPNPILAMHSDDGGTTFSAPVRVSSPTRPRAAAPALAIGADHAVHVLYYDLGEDARDYQGLEGPTWEGHWALVLTTSGDGGVRFNAEVVVDDEVVPPERVMLIFTMPPPALAANGAGALFAAWTDARSGDWDVLLRRSHHGGRSWDEAHRLNDDPLTNGRHQYLPRLGVAPDGRLDAIFYDRRGDAANLRHDVFYTFSRDEGRTFFPNDRLTTYRSDSRIGQRYLGPAAVGKVDLGSRLGLLSQKTAVLAAWADTRRARSSRSQDVFAAQAKPSR
ncbi:MAG TPA: sialidase family protein [Acidimicrobiales bacterium]|nr:sialidase family protein [Acidimicrobiales bacterium]